MPRFPGTPPRGVEGIYGPGWTRLASCSDCATSVLSNMLVPIACLALGFGLGFARCQSSLTWAAASKFLGGLGGGGGITLLGSCQPDAGAPFKSTRRRLNFRGGTGAGSWGCAPLRACAAAAAATVAPLTSTSFPSSVSSASRMAIMLASKEWVMRSHTKGMCTVCTYSAVPQLWQVALSSSGRNTADALLPLFTSAGSPQAPHTVNQKPSDWSRMRLCTRADAPAALSAFFSMNPIFMAPPLDRPRSGWWVKALTGASAQACTALLLSCRMRCMYLNPTRQGRGSTSPLRPSIMGCMAPRCGCPSAASSPSMSRQLLWAKASSATGLPWAMANKLACVSISSASAWRLGKDCGFSSRAGATLHSPSAPRTGMGMSSSLIIRRMVPLLALRLLNLSPGSTKRMFWLRTPQYMRPRSLYVLKAAVTTEGRAPLGNMVLQSRTGSAVPRRSSLPMSTSPGHITSPTAGSPSGSSLL